MGSTISVTADLGGGHSELKGYMVNYLRLYLQQGLVCQKKFKVAIS